MPGSPQHLSNQLAEQILVDSFEGESFLDEEDLKYLSDLDPNASFTDILNEYHKTDINNRLVELYISEIPECKQSYLHLKYGRHCPKNVIADSLGFSPRTLEDWLKEIREDVFTLSFLRIPESMMFSLSKLKGMVENIDRYLDFLRKQTDCHFAVELIDDLIYRRYIYTAMHQELIDANRMDEMMTTKQIVLYTKVQFPHLSERELAVKAGLSISTVSRWLNHFKAKYPVECL